MKSPLDLTDLVDWGAIPTMIEGQSRASGKLQRVTPAHQASRGGKARVLERGQGDKDARPKGQPIRNLVGLGLHNGSDLDRAAADLHAIADLQTEPFQQDGIYGSAGPDC